MILLGPCPTCDCDPLPCAEYPLTLDVEVPTSGWDVSGCESSGCSGAGQPEWDGLVTRDPGNTSTTCLWSAGGISDPIDAKIAGLMFLSASITKGAGGTTQTLTLRYRCWDGFQWVSHKLWEGNLTGSASPAGTYTRDPAAPLGDCGTCKGCTTGVESITVSVPPP